MDKLKDRIDKRGEGGAFGKNNQQTEQEENNDNRYQPPFFAGKQKLPEFFYNT